MNVPKRQSVAIHAEVVEAFQQACRGRHVGRSMNDAATRILSWWSRQQQVVQTAVAADVDRGMEHYYAHALRRLADELEGITPYPEKGDPTHQFKSGAVSTPAPAPALVAKGKQGGPKSG